MPYGTIANGDSGASVRAQLNTLLANCAVNAPVTPAPFGGSNGTLLSYGTTFVNVAENGGDSLQLPPALAGARVELWAQNNMANLIEIWWNGDTYDTVNGIVDMIDWFPPTDTGSPTPPLVFLCGVDGAWNTNGELD